MKPSQPIRTPAPHWLTLNGQGSRNIFFGMEMQCLAYIYAACTIDARAVAAASIILLSRRSEAVAVIAYAVHVAMCPCT